MIIEGFIFALGLIFGSFLNAWEYRLEKNRSLKGRSFCPKCKKQIAWYDNIPLLSWILLRGKCRKCHKHISIQYPLIELITGLLFLLLWIYTKPGLVLSEYLTPIINLQYTNHQLPIIEILQFLLLTSCCLLLLLVAIHDAKTKYVPTKHVYLAGALGLTYNLFNINLSAGLGWVLPYLWAVTIPAGSLWLLSKLSKERLMGAGDADIALAIGLLLGWPKVLPAYYIAFISGAIYGISVFIRKKGGPKSQVPLGPFLVAGTYITFIFGRQIIDAYLHLIGVV